MRKEDLRLAAGLTTNMIANMGKGKHISMETLLRICGTLDCDIADVIELKKDWYKKMPEFFIESGIFFYIIGSITERK